MWHLARGAVRAWSLLCLPSLRTRLKGKRQSWAAHRGLQAEVGKAEEETIGVRLGCIPGKEHVTVQELCYKKTLLVVLRRGQHMAW